MCGAYPFPGDLRAKFAWKEANRLSREELIDNTAVTCSSLDRRSVAPSLTPPLGPPPLCSAVLSNSEKFTLSVSIGVQHHAARSRNPGFTPGASRFDAPCVTLFASRGAHVHCVLSVPSEARISRHQWTAIFRRE